MTNPCKICGKEEAKRCGKCHKVFYCSVQCQRKDWKSHKEACNSSLQATPVASTDHDSDELPKAVFSRPFTLEKFVLHVNSIKGMTKNCAEMWVDLRMKGKMPVDSSLPTCFVYFTSFVNAGKPTCKPVLQLRWDEMESPCQGTFRNVFYFCIQRFKDVRAQKLPTYRFF